MTDHCYSKHARCRAGRTLDWFTAHHPTVHALAVCLAGTRNRPLHSLSLTWEPSPSPMNDMVKKLLLQHVGHLHCLELTVMTTGSNKKDKAYEEATAWVRDNLKLELKWTGDGKMEYKLD